MKSKTIQKYFKNQIHQEKHFH